MVISHKNNPFQVVFFLSIHGNEGSNFQNLSLFFANKSIKRKIKGDELIPLQSGMCSSHSYNTGMVAHKSIATFSIVPHQFQESQAGHILKENLNKLDFSFEGLFGHIRSQKIFFFLKTFLDSRLDMKIVKNISGFASEIIFLNL